MTLYVDNFCCEDALVFNTSVMFAPCRTCTLTLSHLAVFEQVEPGLNFIVISVSMKVSHHYIHEEFMNSLWVVYYAI